METLRRSIGNLAIDTTEQLLECLCGFAVRGYRSNTRVKYIKDGDKSVAVECCYEILSNLHIKHPIGDILLDCVSTFHGKYGCSVRTLLILILVWYRVYIRLIKQDIPANEVNLTLSKILDSAVQLVREQASHVSTLLSSPISSSEPRTGSSYCRESEKTAKSVSSHLFESVEDLTSTNKACAEHKLQAVETSLPDGLSDEPDVDDISWYFSPDEVVIDEPKESSINNVAEPISQSERAQSESVVIHSDDDDFADCFDDIRPTLTSEGKKECLTDIDWLNNALASIKMKSNGTATTIQNNVSKPKILSRHLQESDKIEQAERSTRINDGQASRTNDSLFDKTVHDESGTAAEDTSPGHTLSSTHSCLDNLSDAPSPSTIQDLIPGISRHDDLISDLLTQTLRVVSNHQTHDYMLTNDSLSDVNVIPCVGPLSNKSSVIHGTVLPSSGDIVQQLEENSTFKTLLFQGDLKEDYTHTGYKRAVKHKTELKVTQLHATPSDRWCDRACKLVLQCGVTCILMKGCCDSTLKLNFLSQRVIVIEHVNHSILTYIASHCNIPILHYIQDCHQRYTTDIVLSDLDLSSLGKKVKPLLRLSLPESGQNSNCQLTVIVCSPVLDECQIIAERYHHALHRLKNIIRSKKCLYTFSLTHLSSSLCAQASQDGDDSILHETVQYLNQELFSLVPLSSKGKGDDYDSNVDDLDSVTAALETSLSFVKYISTISLIVNTGAGDRPL